MPKPWTYSYKEWEYIINRKWKVYYLKKRDEEEAIMLNKEIDWSFTFGDGWEYMLIMDREHFHILDVNDPDSNTNKTHNYWIEFDESILAEYIKTNKEISSIINPKYVFTREPLREPNEKYIFINIFSDRKEDKNFRVCIWDIRIIWTQEDKDKVMYDSIKIISEEINKLKYKSIDSIEIEREPILLRHQNKPYIIQDIKVKYQFRWKL